jgi:hypothetical protein
MTNLNEYKIQIKNISDLEKWKSTWVPGTPIPEEVVRYMKTVVIPRLIEYADGECKRMALFK